MTIEQVDYSKTFNLGNYSNEKIGVVVKLAPGENPLDAFAEAKRQVEKGHQFFKEMPLYEAAKKAVAHPDNHTGREVKQAQEAITAFEANYADYISKFYSPVSRQLNEGYTANDDDCDEN
ncbi:MAG TPA: hypothetical protein PL045_07065 [Chitinophagaceae bacterium]|nr:hypothetical protein [Chitinophagaceae bacterium]